MYIKDIIYNQLGHYNLILHIIDYLNINNNNLTTHTYFKYIMVRIISQYIFLYTIITTLKLRGEETA